MTSARYGNPLEVWYMSKVCERCGEPLAEGAAFCEQCGAPVMPSDENRAPAGMCPHCGAGLTQGNAFCTNCGTPVEGTQPTPSHLVCPACGAALEQGERFCSACGLDTSSMPPCPNCGNPVQPGARFCPSCSYQLSSVPPAGSPRKSRLPLVIAIAAAVVIALIVIALVLIPKPDDDTVVTGGTGGSSTSSQPDGSTNAAAYEVLASYYGDLSGYESRVKSSMDVFNRDYLKASYNTRSSDYAEAQRLQNEIADHYAALQRDASGVGLPSDSTYSSQYRDILRLYELLALRMDVLNQAWARDVQYSSPSAHEDYICEPIRGAQSSGTSVYKTEYDNLYPNAAPRR